MLVLLVAYLPHVLVGTCDHVCGLGSISISTGLPEMCLISDVDHGVAAPTVGRDRCTFRAVFELPKSVCTMSYTP